MRDVWKLPLIVGTVLLAEFARADTTQDYVELTCDPGQTMLSVRYVTVEERQTMSAVDAQPSSDKARVRSGRLQTDMQAARWNLHCQD